MSTWPASKKCSYCRKTGRPLYCGMCSARNTIDDLEAENARLVEWVAQIEADLFADTEVDELLTARVVKAEALAERRGEVLEGLLAYVTEMAARTVGQPKEMLPDKRIGVARAALAATLDEARERKSGE